MPATLDTQIEIKTDAPAYIGKERSGADHPTSNKVVVVHGGARDGYQVALALSQVGLLETLVTDLFWPSGDEAVRVIERFIPAALLQTLRRRSVSGLPASKVKNCFAAGIGGLLLDRARFLPFWFRRLCVRASDANLGTTAGRLAKKNKAGLVSYSYFGSHAFREFGQGGILFQAHPHPATMRAILQKELADHPDCARSLTTEWELALPEKDFNRLTDEISFASRYLVASSFTRDSLAAHGVRRDFIQVIPYGVDLQRFRPNSAKKAPSGSALRLLFVGRLNQRKGIKYLLQALRLLPNKTVHLTVCGRVLDEQDLLRPFADLIEMRSNVNAEDLVQIYQSADLFVFPSVGEGFGQVLLEALACGLPILTTTHTAAPDLIEDGVQGFIVEPRRSDLLAERIHWATAHRAELCEMGNQARQRATHFTLERFRKQVGVAVSEFLGEIDETQERGAA